MSAEFFQDAYPAIRERFGRDQELAIELKFKNPRFFFGLTDSDIAFSSQLNLGLKLEDGMNYLIYDELDFYTEFDMTIEQEEIYGNINEMRWTKGGSNPDRDVPVWNDIDITAEEYSQFWEWMNDKSDSFYRWANKYVFEAGVQLPYWNLEFLTKLTFYPHAVLSVIDMYYNSSEQ